MIFSNWSWRQEGRKKERIMITMNLNHYRYGTAVKVNEWKQAGKNASSKNPMIGLLCFLLGIVQ
jgi:hypothetical protein